MIYFRLPSPKSSLLLLSILTLPMAACTTKPAAAPADVIVPIGSAADSGSTSPAEGVDKAATDSDLPPELQNAGSFNPAASLDQNTIKNGDFYQINKTMQDEQVKRDAAWVEQDRLESSVLAHKKAEDAARLKKIQDDEKAIELDRQSKSSKSKIDKESEEERKAAEEVSKMPTISDDELNWKALEHHH